MSRPYILAETTWATVRETQYDVAVLPWGATEAHNYHLPYATDTIQSDGIAYDAARLAWEAGAKVIVLPAIAYGIQTGQLDIPLCLNMNPSTQFAIIEDIASSLREHGIEKLVILNGHGGNEFRGLIRELSPRVDMFLCVVNWFNVVPQGEYFSDLGDHAGELETSVMMHYAPELVRPLSEAGDGAEKKAKIEGLRERWAWTPRRWTQVSEDTGIGNPALATPDKGQRYTQAVTEKIGAFLADLAEADVQDLYQ